VVADSPDSVLLETSRFDATNNQSLLFVHPVQVLAASKLDEIPRLFSQLEEALANGFYVAGFIGYECGYHFQPLNAVTLDPSDLPLAWFGVYRSPLIYDHQRNCVLGDSSLPLAHELRDEMRDIPDRVVNQVTLTLSEEQYCAKVDRIKDYIRAGDTYQVNLTDRVDVPMTASPVEAFAVLSHRQSVSYGAFLHVGDRHILSLSPELFFKIDGDKIVTRPMKGTMPRGLDAIEDIEVALRLQNDEKNRAEHVMIVDLLRSDLGRICSMGSVKVEDIFSVEKYETLFQMTSTISGVLRPGLEYYEIFKSLFPSGSITGAPKIRTMQIIHELEQRRRGVYTGAIGFISPNRSSSFNVAIRTLVLEGGRARMGVGGGIVADSQPADEYRECLLKASFLTRTWPEFQLVETMLWDGEYSLLAMHLDRMESSASYFNFPFDRPLVSSQVMKQSNQFQVGNRYRVRLLLDSAGQLTTTSTTYVPDISTGCVYISMERTLSTDVFLRHKTTYRERYDRLYAEARVDGFDEIIILNERGEVTEGAISNIFIMQNGTLITPPLHSGLLPGVLRRQILESTPTSKERVLTVHDLECADAVYLCNSLRGMRQVQSLCLDASLRESSVTE
jgi:para-aminobenzoate synthetase/4-amino-4-deoxychorismate lyase